MGQKAVEAFQACGKTFADPEMGKHLVFLRN